MTHLRLLPVVKAYPVIDPSSFSEAVCVAGITIDAPHRWIRLFPLDFRGLERVQRFRKYQVIELDAKRSRGDSRPESYTPVLDSIEAGEHIDSDSGTWRRRLVYVDSVMDESMCQIHNHPRSRRQSLGVFRPEMVTDLKVEPVPAGFAARQQAVLQQASLLGDRAGDRVRALLEPLPVKAKFQYRCSDPDCSGHNQSLIDWELGQLCRNLADRGDDEETIMSKVREKFFEHYCGPQFDTRFIVGSMLRRPASFLVLGLVHPRRGQPAGEQLF